MYLRVSSGCVTTPVSGHTPDLASVPISSRQCHPTIVDSVRYGEPTCASTVISMRACIRAPLVRPRRDHRPHRPNTPRGDTRRPIFLQENQHHHQPLATTSPPSPLRHASATVQRFSVRAGTSLHACISAARVSDPSPDHPGSQPPAPRNPRYPSPKNRTNVSHLFLSFLLCLRARAQGPGPTPVPRRGPLMQTCIMGHPRRPAADVTVRSRNRTQRGPHNLFTLSPRRSPGA